MAHFVHPFLQGAAGPCTAPVARHTAMIHFQYPLLSKHDVPFSFLQGAAEPCTALVAERAVVAHFQLALLPHQYVRPLHSCRVQQDPAQHLWLSKLLWPIFNSHSLLITMCPFPFLQGAAEPCTAPVAEQA
eukprot:1137412-Pelagomonas_calceolata.AAC.1